MPAPVQDVAAVIVGAGPAGLGAAARLARCGLGPIVVLDREAQPGGLPAQSEHHGFGLRRYKRPLRGFDYAARLASAATRAGVDVRLQTTVLRVTPDRTVLTTSAGGVLGYRARVVILATGCREAPRPLRSAAGTRPAGIYNTAVVHRLLGLLHERPGRRAVVVGSEDVGLMAVRLLERSGTRVAAVIEELPYLLGYRVNLLYSVIPFRVPVLLGHAVVGIVGHRRVEGVDVRALSTGQVTRIPCDTVVFSGRFLPESGLAREAEVALDPRTGGPIVDQHYRTSIPGIFACGNVLHGAESSDTAFDEGVRCGEAAAAYAAGRLADVESVWCEGCGHVAAIVPQRLTPGARGIVRLLVRPDAPLAGVTISARCDGKRIGGAWRPWAMPHRASTVLLRLPLVPRGGRLQIDMRGHIRGPRYASAAPFDALPPQRSGAFQAAQTAGDGG